MSETDGPHSARDGGRRGVATFGAFRYEWGSGLLFQGDEEILLPVRVAAVLEQFLLRPSELLTKDDLLEAAWTDVSVGEESLTKAISRIRLALHDDPASPRFIQTLPRRGYRFVAQVSVEGGPPRLHTGAPSNPAAGQPPGPASPFRRVVGSVALVAVAALAVLFWARQRLPEAAAPGETGQLAAAADRPLDLRRLAVPPFEAPSAEAEAVAARLRSEIVGLLEEETTLALVSADPGMVALLGPADLGAPADEVLGASVQLDDGLFDIAVSVDAAMGNLWRARWTIPQGHLGEAELARSVFTRLSYLLDLLGPDSEIRGSHMPEAVLAFMRASQLLQGATQQNLRDTVVAEELLDRALSLDPEFARARAARVGFRAEAVRWGLLPAEQLPDARAEAEVAVRDDPTDPLAYVAGSLIDHLMGDHDAERRDLERALELDPRALWAYLTLAATQVEMGDLAQALTSAREAQRLDWYLPATHSKVVDVLLELGRHDEAVAASEQLAALEPEGFFGRRVLARSLYLRNALGDSERAEPILLALHEEFATSPWPHEEALDFYRATGRAALADQEQRHLAEMQ